MNACFFSRLAVVAVVAGIVMPLRTEIAHARTARRFCAIPQRTWHMTESENFRIYSYGTCPISPRTVQACEDTRAELVARWLRQPLRAWSPRCDLVIHPDDTSYRRAVGADGEQTFASSFNEKEGGRVLSRRIDVRGTVSDWLTSVLPHEMTHVLVADCFSCNEPPAWLDESFALLADPASLQQLHLQEFTDQCNRDGVIPLAKLFQAAPTAASERRGMFYGQCLSLAQFLVQLQGTQAFWRFGELAATHGVDSALRAVYQLDGVSDLQTRWLQQNACARR
jgi:hypothetical protein